MPIEITELLDLARRGDRAAEEEVFRLVYGELHRLAESYMRRERRDHTLQASALVNEAYVRLLGRGTMAFSSRAHFLVTAAKTMRRILVGHARARLTTKRGAGGVKLELDETLASIDNREQHWVALDEALERLEQIDLRQAKVVELRFIGGQTVEETAAILEISPKTVKRDWAMARAWLEGELRQAT